MPINRVGAQRLSGVTEEMHTYKPPSRNFKTRLDGQCGLVPDLEIGGRDCGRGVGTL